MFWSKAKTATYNINQNIDDSLLFLSLGIEDFHSVFHLRRGGALAFI